MSQQISFSITPEQEASKLQFIRRQFFSSGPPAISRRDVDLSGKTAIVTGANGGIGLECSRQLLDLRLTKLILAVRDGAKGEIARKALTTAKPLEVGQVIEIWKLDHSSYDSVVAFARRAGELNPRLDITILNAGVNRDSFVRNSTTGHEEDLQTNYLSTVLLTLLLLRVFKNRKSVTDVPKASPGRIVIVSSDMAAWAKFNERNKEPLLKAFDDEAKWDKYDRYGTTKLLGQLFVTELAKRISPSLAVVNCTNPGLCYGSTLSSELGRFTHVFVRLVGRPAAAGALTLVHAATKDESSHGQYVEDGEIRPMAPFVYSKEAEEVTQRLWKETMEELAFAGVQEIVDSLSQT
ncbi:NAD(P)-binding protein [Hypoxylon trugodes]|uniref:NAD(P)-binding protein n=1 Tax=Hypoxylon trugodes TaxID=326681 RepID=UPI002197BF09|nr:NAD(P)-binding protein [Hypoxylon trugodes]KAI1394176.1 NAD(P)-binding protein [Hypoxylon trugodes]